MLISIILNAKYATKTTNGPHIFAANRCRTRPLVWLDDKRKQMLFSVPMVCCEQSDYVTDCYFCITNIRGFFQKSKSKMSYPECKSAIRPVFHNLDLPVPKPPTVKDIRCLLMNMRVLVLKLRRILLS